MLASLCMFHKILRPSAKRAYEVGRNTPDACIGDSLTGSKIFYFAAGIDQRMRYDDILPRYNTPHSNY